MHRHFRLPALAALFLTGAFSVWAADTPVKGGTLIYLEQQPHTNLYPPAGGFYPNGGILNQITGEIKPIVCPSRRSSITTSAAK